jgi:hypothetical protein
MTEFVRLKVANFSSRLDNTPVCRRYLAARIDDLTFEPLPDPVNTYP